MTLSEPPAHDAPGDARAPLPLDAGANQAVRDGIRVLRLKGLLFGALGLSLQAARYIDSGGLRPASAEAPVYVLLPIAGIGLLIYALSLSARARNRSPWWGLLGMGSCVGVVGFLLLGKKCHFCRAKMKGHRCPRCGAQEPV